MGCLIWIHGFLCLISFLLHSKSSALQLCHESQSSILLQFKNTFFIDNDTCSYSLCESAYPKMFFWKEGTDCCYWDGVMCDTVAGYVIALNLSCSQLCGTIHHNNTLFLLQHLRRLNLAYNNFNNSQISPMFGRLVNLTHLNLSSSFFSGSVPSQISYLSKLVLLDLSGNYRASLETPVLERLTQNLTHLRVLYLDEVNMFSVLLTSFMNLSSSLESLSLSKSSLRGKFPDTIFRLPNLQELGAFNNEELTGYLPKFNWSNSLRFLDLSYTSFSGELPDSVGNLKFLKYLHLRDCKFSGSIPTSFGYLTHITSLDLSYNNFSGQIPSSLANLEQITVLDLSNNMFTGQIPNLFANFTNLYRLDFSQNQLVGPIPSYQSVLPNVTDLLLLNNSLNGTIPSWVFNLPQLMILDLSYNQLTGHITEFRSTLLTSIDLGYNKLHGPIPSSIFEIVSVATLMLQSNNLSGSVDLDVFQKFKNLGVLDLSYNSLSLRVNNNENYSTWPKLMILSLSSCNLSEFPNFLRNQQNLYRLDLSNNNIHGQIPRWFYDVGKDTLNILDLSHNFLTSIEPFPHVNLGILDLHSNMLEGPLQIPPPNTLFFSLSNNRFTGHIPSTICDIKSLQVLDLSNNSLSGTIPQCLGNSLPRLSVLNLRMNNLIGSIPETFVADSDLKNINLNANQLEGSMPRSLVNCKMLQILDLGNNNINDTFPQWLETLPELQVLDLGSNRFHGFIDCCSTRISFSKLRIIDLSDNEFNGHLPARFFENLKGMVEVDEDKVVYMGEELYQYSVTVTVKGWEIELGRIITIFTAIDLSNNSFGGEIPKNIGKFRALKGLNISHNGLTGYIPQMLGNLTNLEWLDLSSNKLGGEIPRELLDLTFLAVLNLSKNHLVGPIPRGKQFNTFENDSYTGNLGLCGIPLTKKCGEDKPAEQPPPREGEGDSEFSNECNWNVILMGYGYGVVFGFITGCVVFLSGKPQWLVRITEGHRMVRGSKHRLRAK